MARFDPRTKLALGLVVIGAVFLARRPETLLLECVALLVSVPLLGMARAWVRSLRVLWPTVALVFAITSLSYDIWSALVLSIRLFNLLTASFIFFRLISPEEMAGAFQQIGIPFKFTFILTTAMRYVPLIKQKIRNIIDAQLSRGIDLRLRIRNARNLLALLLPLLVQSFVLSEELAIAMESRGFGRQGRSSRKQYRLAFWEYVLMVLSFMLLAFFASWERGWGL